MQKQHQQQVIYFYKQYQDYGYFSNFYQSPFKQANFTYLTNEHYFQSKKYQGQQFEKVVASAKTPLEAFNLGRSKPNDRKKNWQQIKEDVMYHGLKLKFDQNPELKKKLIESGNKKLVEHTKNDKYWADGKDGSGKNRLGALLMKLRHQYKQNEK